MGIIWVSNGYQQGNKNRKGAVSLENYRGRIRLRWRHQGRRYSLNLLAYNKTNLAAARKVCLQIELDMANQSFDYTLVRYGAKRPVEEEAAPIPKTIVECFETWTKDFKQLDCDVNSNDSTIDIGRRGLFPIFMSTCINDSPTSKQSILRLPCSVY